MIGPLSVCLRQLRKERIRGLPSQRVLSPLLLTLVCAISSVNFDHAGPLSSHHLTVDLTEQSATQAKCEMQNAKCKFNLARAPLLGLLLFQTGRRTPLILLVKQRRLCRRSCRRSASAPLTRSYSSGIRSIRDTGSHPPYFLFFFILLPSTNSLSPLTSQNKPSGTSPFRHAPYTLPPSTAASAYPIEASAHILTISTRLQYDLLVSYRCFRIDSVKHNPSRHIHLSSHGQKAHISPIRTFGQLNRFLRLALLALAHWRSHGSSSHTSFAHFPMKNFVRN